VYKYRAANMAVNVTGTGSIWTRVETIGPIDFAKNDIFFIYYS
jgi:hypothetical protein